MKLWNVDFEPLYPVGSCLIILAHDKNQAREIASNTIKHTTVFEIEEVPMDKPLVVVYQSGEY
ncbi:MAG: hypothetical protein ACOCWC_04865 [Bacteroidota bacterium]